MLLKYLRRVIFFVEVATQGGLGRDPQRHRRVPVVFGVHGPVSPDRTLGPCASWWPCPEESTRQWRLPWPWRPAMRLSGRP
jgi:hypothetical protein